MPGNAPSPAERWSSLPPPAQAAVLGLLARMIARGVVIEEVPVGDDRG
jgi:hypothetical protein